MLDAYLTSQIRMIRDLQVAATAAELMGWMDNPDILAAYAARPASDNRDLPTWVASILIPRVGVRMVDGSNIMEISYYGDSEELSRQAADALRTAYVQSDIILRQFTAEENATRLSVRLDQVRGQIDSLVAMQARLSQDTGVALGPLGRDQASVDLAALLDRDVRPIVNTTDDAPSLASRELIQANAMLSGAERSLGPNHPTLLQLKARVELLKERVGTEATSRQVERQLIDAANAASQAQIEDLKTRVLAQRQPALRLKLLQDQIDVRKEEVNALAQAVMSARAIQSTRATAITPIGEASAESRPVFPNHLLILGGTTALGMVLGGMMACLAEIIARRVRNEHHIESATGAVLLAVLPAAVVNLGGSWDVRSEAKPMSEAAEESAA